MKKIIAYLLFFAALDIAALILLQLDAVSVAILKLRPILMCAFIGGLGGALYCLRGVYLNASAFKTWDDAWAPWYYIRPIVSHFCGAVSYVFLKAGLLLLEAKNADNATNLGFLALAFIAGLNVDKFIAKIEDLAQATWGIEKSRTAQRKEKQ
jgi:hypothetical protein